MDPIACSDSQGDVEAVWHWRKGAGVKAGVEEGLREWGKGSMSRLAHDHGWMQQGSTDPGHHEQSRGLRGPST